MKRFVGLLLTVALGLAVLPSAAGAAGPYCGLRWGSLPKAVTTGSTGEVDGVRTGRHPCFDRLVVDVDGGDVAGYFVHYVDQVTMDGSGAVVPVRGGARLMVIATAPVDPSIPTFRPGREVADVRGYRTFRHVAWAGSFEGQTSFGLGVRARLPFRVFTLDGPGDGSRLVLDVAHRW